MERLYVLYDDRCGLCRRAKEWAAAQPAFVPLVFLAAGSDAAQRVLSEPAAPDEPEELVAVSDEGHVYRNERAWIMCLYALKETREWSLRLASPSLAPLARQAFTVVSDGRRSISRWLGLDVHEAARELNRVVLFPCDRPASASPLRRFHELASGSADAEQDGGRARPFSINP